MLTPTALPRTRRQVSPSLGKLGRWERAMIPSTDWPPGLDVRFFILWCRRPPNSNTSSVNFFCWDLVVFSAQERLVVQQVDISCSPHYFPVVRMPSKLCL